MPFDATPAVPRRPVSFTEAAVELMLRRTEAGNSDDPALYSDLCALVAARGPRAQLREIWAHGRLPF